MGLLESESLYKAQYSISPLVTSRLLIYDNCSENIWNCMHREEKANLITFLVIFYMQIKGLHMYLIK